jgi:hypothetical protein
MGSVGPQKSARVNRTGVFSCRGPTPSGAGRGGPGLRPPTRRQKAALGRRAKGYGCPRRIARYGPPPVASAEGGPQAGEGRHERGLREDDAGGMIFRRVTGCTHAGGSPTKGRLENRG